MTVTLIGLLNGLSVRRDYVLPTQDEDEAMAQAVHAACIEGIENSLIVEVVQ